MDDFLDDAFLAGLLDDEEYLYMSDTARAGPNRGVRTPFSLENFTEEECLKKFRFWKEDIPKLCVALSIPDPVRIGNRCKASNVECVCILLRRLACKGRTHDLSDLFGREESVLNRFFAFAIHHVYDNFNHLLNTFDAPVYTRDFFDYLCERNAAKGSLFPNCIGFLDGTLVEVCRPTGPNEIQRQLFCYKKFHAFKYQSLLAPNGLILQLDGPCVGKHHNSFMLQQSALLDRVRAVNLKYNIPMAARWMLYADSAYQRSLFLMRAFKDAAPGSPQAHLNNQMKSVRIAVEWGFGKVGNYFRFTRDCENHKIFLVPIGKYHPVAVLLANAHTCLYGSETSKYFDCKAPTLAEYFNR